VTRNVATLVIGKPRRKEGHDEVMEHCWTAEEAKQFLNEVNTAGHQMEVFYNLALDTGARKGELYGLLWQDVDLSGGQIQIVRQLVKPGAPPQFGPPKKANRVPSL
jgi:integrase